MVSNWYAAYLLPFLIQTPLLIAYIGAAAGSWRGPAAAGALRFAVPVAGRSRPLSVYAAV